MGLITQMREFQKTHGNNLDQFVRERAEAKKKATEAHLLRYLGASEA